MNKSMITVGGFQETRLHIPHQSDLDNLHTRRPSPQFFGKVQVLRNRRRRNVRRESLIIEVSEWLIQVLANLPKASVSSLIEFLPVVLKGLARLICRGPEAVTRAAFLCLIDVLHRLENGYYYLLEEYIEFTVKPDSSTDKLHDKLCTVFLKMLKEKVPFCTDNLFWSILSTKEWVTLLSMLGSSLGWCPNLWHFIWNNQLQVWDSGNNLAWENYSLFAVSQKNVGLEVWLFF